MDDGVVFVAAEMMPIVGGVIGAMIGFRASIHFSSPQRQRVGQRLYLLCVCPAWEKTKWGS
ncbi:MAG: hypothetical protein ACI9R3_003807, partial [Verrucomicrobiales bacterium]